jgi:hypothetical protein
MNHFIQSNLTLVVFCLLFLFFRLMQITIFNYQNTNCCNSSKEKNIEHLHEYLETTKYV